MPKSESLIDTLALERIEVNLFRGQAPKDDGPRIFGGLVIAQALLAAYATVEHSLCHSIHCYFLRPGDPSIPILYEVDRARDGRSFTSRRVTAIQHGEQIFNLAGSFQHPESGLEHQDPMPATPSPDALADEGERRRRLIANLPEPMRQMAERPRPIDMRPVDPEGFMAGKAAPPFQNVWMRAAQPIGDDPVFNQAVLAYASDMSFLSTSMRPHGLSWQVGGLTTASIDHALWFHRPCNFNDWHLFVQKSPSASGARGFNIGEIYSQDGRLVASAAQEGLMRYRPPSSEVLT
jgi:acyl-CoA thioesterase II